MRPLLITGLKGARLYLTGLCLPLIFLYGCGVTVVYQDTFDSTPVGTPPGPPQIGTSGVSGDVVIAENPVNDISPDHWLQLKRVGTNPPVPAEYVATLKEPVTVNGGVALVGYIPAFNPTMMSVFFETPAFGPSATLMHIDLLPDGKIRLNDSTIEGTYKFDKSIGFLVSLDLDASPPTATIIVRGGAQDANATVNIPATVAGFGFGRIRIAAAFNAPQGRFLINDVTATKKN